MSGVDGGSERLTLTVLFSGIVHALVLLGVGFTAPRPPPATPTLDVMLVASSTQQAPEQADFLAQANQEGGGTLEEKARPSALASSPVTVPVEGSAEVERRQSAPRVSDEQPAPVVATLARRPEQAPATRPRERTDLPLPEDDELQRLRLEQARLAAERAEIDQRYARRPLRHFISAQTRADHYAAYMRAWVARVERVGNLNYPDEAREQQVHGNLILTVAIWRDGSVESIEIVQSSGHRILDEAARQIVRLSAPFNPLPDHPDPARRADILHITRTWQFLPGDVLRHR